MAASSSSSSSQRCEQFANSFIPAHDIFLSHSGAQKPFVKALYRLLSTRYATFFDITHHSLPLAQPFPSRILCAAQTCRLAIVVLSHDYVQSKWPMIELCAFMAAIPPPKILPLFFKLAPNDLKQKRNQNKWRTTWKKFAMDDPSRIDVSAWESSFRKLSGYNGILLNQSEEESAYIERVFSHICENVPPSMRHDFSGLPGIHRLSEIVLTKFEALHTDQSKVCVLGMYGLPGSGKSTLCRYLCDHLFSQFAGKVLYLELPTDAVDEELLVKSKELLKQLTDFNNKMDLSNVSNFRQVYHLLRGTDFLNSRVFLVVDNISSQKSSNFVMALLRLGLAVGSKVLLVAPSSNALCPFLQEDGPHQNSLYVYGTTSVPGLNNEEALRVLLQSGDGLGLADSYAPEAALTPRSRQIMEEVVSRSSFQGAHLPLVLKIIGEQLREHEPDVENWNRTMKTFWTEMGLCKAEALKQLVLENFRKLPRKLQNLFLDVALFILPLSYLDDESLVMDEACFHLSLIHGCKPEEIKFEMQKLQKHGYLTILRGTCGIKSSISVHDVYLEFAASIEEASKYYWSSGHRWSKIRCVQAIEVAATTELGLRTVVLELDEAYEQFEFSSELSSVRAMVLRNCKSLKTLWGCANLTFLVSLEINNCPRLKWVETPATGCKLPYLQRLRWVNKQENKGCNVKMLQQQELGVSSSNNPLWQWMVCFLPKVLPGIGLKRSSIAVDGLLSPQIGVQGPRMMAVDGLLLQMKGLQALRLENTGIRQFVDLSRCLPQLRVLEVRECDMQHFDVCNLPNLERFLFDGDANSVIDLGFDSHSEIKDRVSLVPRKGVLRGKDFLAGCPKLQDVCVRCVSLEDELQGITIVSPDLKSLWVNRFWNASRLPDLSASAESLEHLRFWDCQEVRSLNFRCKYRNLRQLWLRDCPNVSEVTGLDALPNLLLLRIQDCACLKIVSGVRTLASLQRFEVGWRCPNLERCLLCDLESLTELRSIEWNGRAVCLMDGVFNVRKLVNLETLRVTSSDKVIGLENLKSLKKLGVSENRSSAEKPDNVDLARLLGVDLPPPFSIECLGFWRLISLTSLKRIEFLQSLTALELVELPDLSCLQGIGSLINLRSVDLWGCALVEEMPSLSALAKLEWLSVHNCIKLRSVEGCEGLAQLLGVWFTACKSLARFPLDWRNLNSSITCLRIEGSEFASAEALVAWAEDEEAARVLRLASVRALRWELSKSSNNNQKNASDMLLDKVVLERRSHNDNVHYDEDFFTTRLSLLANDYHHFEDEAKKRYSYWSFYEELFFTSGSACAKWYQESRPDMLEEGLWCVAKLPKQRLIDLCQSDTHFRIFVLHLFCGLCKFISHP